FEVRLVITGGTLTQQPNGPYRAGQNLAFLIHQPGLTITSFPHTFSFSAAQTRLYTGVSDALKMRERLTNPDPLIPACDCTTSDVPPNPGGDPMDSAGGMVPPNSGAARQQVTDVSIPGRGFDLTFTRTYRSDVQHAGTLGNNWDFNYDRRLLVAVPQNLTELRL